MAPHQKKKKIMADIIDLSKKKIQKCQRDF